MAKIKGRWWLRVVYGNEHGNSTLTDFRNHFTLLGLLIDGLRLRRNVGDCDILEVSIIHGDDTVSTAHRRNKSDRV